jgi:hypothetical protein
MMMGEGAILSKRRVSISVEELDGLAYAAATEQPVIPPSSKTVPSLKTTFPDTNVLTKWLTSDL